MGSLTECIYNCRDLLLLRKSGKGVRKDLLEIEEMQQKRESLEERARRLERSERKSLKEKEAKLLGGLLYAQEELIGRLGDKSNSASSKSSSDSGFSSISSSVGLIGRQRGRQGRDRANLLQPVGSDSKRNRGHSEGRKAESSRSRVDGRFEAGQGGRLDGGHQSRTKEENSEKRRRQMRRTQSEAAVNKKSSDMFQSQAKTTSHTQPRKDTPVSKASIGDKFRSKMKGNTFRAQKSLTQSPNKAKLSRGQSIKRSSSNEKPKFAPKAGFAQCSICSRNFAPDRISKHKEICAKSSRKRRKVFDVAASRVEGTDAAQYHGVKVKDANTGNGSDWRKKREEFVATLRTARRDARMIKKGVDPRNLPPPPPSDTSHYIECPHCHRRFAETVAERHIPKCENIRSNKKR